MNFNAVDFESHSAIYNWFFEKFITSGLSEKLAHYFNTIFLFLLFGILLYAVDYLFRWILRTIIVKAVHKSRTEFDDYLIRNKVIKYFMHIISIIFARQFIPIIFVGFPNLLNGTFIFIDIVLIITSGLFINGVFKSIRDWAKTKKAFVDKPIDSYVQVITILIFFICGILIYSLLSGKSPYALLLSLGAASAILMLVFKDTILGFVASIQVSSNDMVRVGDWVEMPKYGADGDVVSINLNTVKIRNWDKTITTVPTYAFITDSFKNWRAMSESGGRRIKRAINLKMSSFKFLDENDIEKFKKYRLIKDYIISKENEIEEFNKSIHAESIPVNIRRLSNVGVFRIYADRYLKENQHINKEMNIMVRQLAPTPQGLPLEIYCFTKDVRWLYYEGIMADIFDHLLTIVPEFGLEIYEEPSGSDMRVFAKNSH